MNAIRMLEQYPAEITMDRDALARAIDAAVTCAQTCTACADACLSEDDVASLTRCIRDDLDCADVCQTTSRVLSRHTAYDARLTPPSCKPASKPATPAPTRVPSTAITTRIARRAKTRAARANARARPFWTRCSRDGRRRLPSGRRSAGQRRGLSVPPARLPQGGAVRPGWLKVFSNVSMLAVLVFAATVTAGIVERLLDRRLTTNVGRRMVPRRNACVVGLGQVGMRLCLLLRELRGQSWRSSETPRTTTSPVPEATACP
jgi:hypothetical protein